MEGALKTQTPNTEENLSNDSVTTGMTPYDFGRYILGMFGKNAPIIIIALLAVYSYGELEDSNQEARAQLQEDLESARERVQKSYKSITELADWQTSGVQKSIDLQDKMKVRLQTMQEEIGTIQQSVLLQQSKDSLRSVIRLRFEQVRKERSDYIDNIWTPLFTTNFMKQGRLVDIIEGRVMWNNEMGDFTEPSDDPDKKQQQIEATLAEWMAAAVGEILQKRAEMLQPLEAQEEELMDSISNLRSFEGYVEILQSQSEIELRAREGFKEIMKADRRIP
jgi:hypothetical protein